VELILVLVVAIATYFDLKKRTIPNWLTYGALAISLLWFSYFHILVLVLGILSALLFGKFVGAGDIKLAVAIAIWSHILNWPQSWLYISLLLGGLFGLANRKKSLPFAPFMAAGVLLANVARSKGFI
jgi:Flp pilus assembly protein protease CpaA